MGDLAVLDALQGVCDALRERPGLGGGVIDVQRDLVILALEAEAVDGGHDGGSACGGIVLCDALPVLCGAERRTYRRRSTRSCGPRR